MAKNQVSLRILIPDGTINYITNPSFRFDTTGWLTQGATLTRVLTHARFGIASGKVVTAGAALHEGAAFRVSALSGVSEAITVSCYVRGSGQVRIRLDDNSVGGGEFVSQPVDLTLNRWTRLSVTGRSHGGNDMRLYVETAESSAKARTFYIDGAQMERHGYATTYCDGDQENCRWLGIYHNSLSERPDSTRSGGRWVELSGPEREAENLYMTVAGGLGMAPITNNIQSYALAEGGYHQGVKIGMRSITLTFHAKVRASLLVKDTNLEKLHALRQFLIDTVKPDKTFGDEAIWFEYKDGTLPIYFQARYDGGLEGDWDVRNGYVNSFPLRLLAVSPILEEDTQEAQELDFQRSFVENFIFGKINGVWQNLNYGFNDNLFQNSLAYGLRGDLYGVANDNGLTVVNNNAAAINPLIPARALIKWDGEKWASVGPAIDTGGTGELYAVAVAPNGYIYVAGNFTSIGGVAANYIAYWDGSAWNALGTGLNNTGRCLAIAPNGNVFVGGDFTTAGGITAYKVAYWDGGTWQHLGTYAGLNNTVEAMVFSQNGAVLYLGGNFTTENGGGLTLTRTASYDIAGGTFSAMGNGFDGIVYDLILSSSGLYAIGNFTLSGSDSIIGIGMWNGSSWVSVNSTYANGVSGILLSDGRIAYATASTSDLTIKLFNGSTWTALDFLLRLTVPLSGSLNGIIANRDDDIIISANKVGTVLCSELNTVTNPGSHETHPVFFIKGPGSLRFIENQTTGKKMYLNLDILSGEEITIDTATGTITSPLRDVSYALLSGSDFHSFVLSPGDNQIACFMYNDVGAVMSVQFPVLHWSTDAGSGEEM